MEPIGPCAVNIAMRLVTLEEHFTTGTFQQATAAAHMPFDRNWVQDKLLDVCQGRVDAMDRAGIDMQVLSFTGFGLYDLHHDAASEIAHDANHQIASAMLAYPGRFQGFATLTMQRPGNAVKELEHCVKTLGFVGAMIDGTVCNEFLDHHRFWPVFEAAAALDVPIYLHPAPPPEAVQKAYTGDLRAPLNFLLSTAAWGWHVETGLHALRLMVSGLFDHLPNLKIILGHMGENLPFSIVRANTVLERSGLKLKRSPLEVFRQNFWITTSGYFTVPPLLCAREVMGADRILLSVDYPFSDMENGRRFVAELAQRLPEDEVEGVAHRNAEKLLKI